MHDYYFNYIECTNFDNLHISRIKYSVNMETENSSNFTEATDGLTDYNLDAWVGSTSNLNTETIYIVAEWNIKNSPENR